MTFKVFEAGSGKWLQVNAGEGDMIFTSDSSLATIFTSQELISADGCFWEFSIYKRTLKAVPFATNRYPSDCDGVKTVVARLWKEWHEAEPDYKEPGNDRQD